MYRLLQILNFSRIKIILFLFLALFSFIFIKNYVLVVGIDCLSIILSNSNTSSSTVIAILSNLDTFDTWLVSGSFFQGPILILKKKYCLFKQSRYYNKLLLLSLIILCSTNQIAFCGTASSNFPTIEQAEELIRLLNREELNQFNLQMEQGLQDYQNSLQNTTPSGNPLIQTLLLVIAINATVIFIARYGTTIWETIRDSAITVAGAISDFFLEQARIAAINRIRTLPPEQLNAAINILNTIIENRPQTGGAA